MSILVRLNLNISECLKSSVYFRLFLVSVVISADSLRREGTWSTVIVGQVAFEFHPVVENSGASLDREDNPVDSWELL